MVAGLRRNRFGSVSRMAFRLRGRASEGRPRAVMWRMGMPVRQNCGHVKELKTNLRELVNSDRQHVLQTTSVVRPLHLHLHGDTHSCNRPHRLVTRRWKNVPVEHTGFNTNSNQKSELERFFLQPSAHNRYKKQL